MNDYLESQSRSHWEYDSIYVGRQPVFDAGLKLNGYELFYRSDSKAPTALFQDAEQATLNVIQSAYVAPFIDIKDNNFIMVNFSFQALETRAPYALPPGNTVIKLSGHADKSPTRIKYLQNLKDEGYTLALDGGIMECARWKDYMDICIVDALDPHVRQIMNRADRIRQAGLTLMAKRVEDQDNFHILKNAGFSLFQGFFFQKPETVKGTNLSTHQIMRLKILQVLQQMDPDLNKLAELLEKEVSLAYRILRYVNSAHFSTPVKIKSIRHALSYIGINQLKTLLEVFLIRGMTPSSKPSELPFTSALRGRFLELASRTRPDLARESDSFFLLGLLSLLDAIFDMPMHKVLESLPLDEDIRKALCQEPSPYLPWLQLAIGFEEAHWSKVDKLVEKLSLDPIATAKNYSKGLMWTKDFFSLHT
ncbi:EAL and HDOD domain-containing protein [Desulfonatronovibrio magnus]|uniref:EAL and HDOD domain-containing protein n=1 Tax=Desulfonatronovibrio magnus TaxID=698827 RepID=UPI000698D2D9|nr:HDOD domain-containing protein [Desulfonatronovibrio magnus]